MSHLLELRGVSKEYGGGVLHRGQGTVALDDVSFSIEDDATTITALAGESGSGKTTLARLLMGSVNPTTGQVLYRGRSLDEMSRAERAAFRRQVQPIFQDPFEVFNPFYRVDHVLEAPIKRFRLARSNREGRKLIEEALELVGLRSRETLGRFPHQLSGGQRQRIMVARALLVRPRVVLADEPVSMVDASLRATILESLRRLNRERGIVVVYITHDLTTAYQICQNVIILYRGIIAEAGSVEEVIKAPKHPYTRLLVSSTPLPDPTKRWGEDAPDGTTSDRTSHGCKFAPRCPAAMTECWEEHPPYYVPDRHRATACFLYRETPTLESPDIADVFTHP